MMVAMKSHLPKHLSYLFILRLLYMILHVFFFNITFTEDLFLTLKQIPFFTFLTMLVY